MSAPPRRNLHTARVDLEPIASRHDAGLVDAILSSRAELLAWMPWAVEPSEAPHKAMREQSQRAWNEDRAYHFAIVIAGDAGGVAGIDRVDADEGEIHYWLRTDLVGHGYVTEAATALIDWAAQELGITRIRLDVGVANVRSVAVAARLGFQRVGAVPGGMDGGLGRFDADRYQLIVTPSRLGSSG